MWRMWRIVAHGWRAVYRPRRWTGLGLDNANTGSGRAGGGARSIDPGDGLGSVWATPTPGLAEQGVARPGQRQHRIWPRGGGARPLGLVDGLGAPTVGSRPVRHNAPHAPHFAPPLRHLAPQNSQIFFKVFQKLKYFSRFWVARGGAKCGACGALWRMGGARSIDPGDGLGSVWTTPTPGLAEQGVARGLSTPEMDWARSGQRQHRVRPSRGWRMGGARSIDPEDGLGSVWATPTPGLAEQGMARGLSTL